jgi:cytochrome c-type biogenesis protein CcmH
MLMDATSHTTVTRREALKRSLYALVPAPLLQERSQGAGGGGQEPAVGRLKQPQLAGRSRTAVTDYENDPFIIGVEEKLRCTCGCNLSIYVCRTTDFTCQTSPALHGDVIALVEQGQTEQEILDAFVARYGEIVLMAPPREGFNLLGYFLPGVAITSVGAVMLWLLSRRVKLRAAAAGEMTASEELTSEDAALLEAELADLER